MTNPVTHAKALEAARRNGRQVADLFIEYVDANGALLSHEELMETWRATTVSMRKWTRDELEAKGADPAAIAELEAAAVDAFNKRLVEIEIADRIVVAGSA